MKSYTRLLRFNTFEDRLKYLQTDMPPSEVTFAELRELNQRFYMSTGWKRVRELVIGRDLGYDLGVPGYDIIGRVIVHHMNPLRPKDLIYHSGRALNPEFLITVSHKTHLAIHFGRDSIGTDSGIIERSPGDTKLW